MAYGSQSSHSTKKVIEALRSRRKTKRSYEYECKWLNKSEEQNTWIEHEKLEEMGWAKMVQRLDQQEALRAGSATRPLTTTFVEKQLGVIMLHGATVLLTEQAIVGVVPMIIFVGKDSEGMP
jgi:hypothetical protein